MSNTDTIILVIWIFFVGWLLGALTEKNSASEGDSVFFSGMALFVLAIVTVTRFFSLS